MKNSVKLILVVALITIVSLILFGIYSLFWIFNLILPAILAFPLTIYTLLRFARFIIRIVTFPGSNWIFLRNMELEFGNIQASSAEHVFSLTAQQVEGLVRMPRKVVTEHLHQVLYSLRSEVGFAEKIIEVQKEKRLPIEESQRNYNDMVVKVKKYLQEIKCEFNGETMTLWEFPEINFTLEHEISEQRITINHIDSKKLPKVFETLKEILEFLKQILNKKLTFKEKVKKLVFEKTFGTTQSMKIELAIKYKSGKSVSLKGRQGNKISCFLIKAPQYYDQSQDNDTSDSEYELCPCPTMVFCNPNAGFLEFSMYQTDWIDFYLAKGINVMLWNYRGYGESGGSPSPDNLKSDAEVVCRYARSKTHSEQKIGAHGMSMGGMIACHLARKGLVDFLFADRSFSSIEETANQMGLGPFVNKIFKFVTGWSNSESTRDYIFSNCYKVIGQDPNDEIVNDNASLKTGVSHSILNNELSLRQKLMLFQEESNFGRPLPLPSSVNAGYTHIIPPEQNEIFYQALEFIYNMSFDLEINNRKLRKFIQKDAKTHLDSSRGGGTQFTEGFDNSQEELKQSKTDADGSYLLTEVETSTRSGISPNTSALNTSSGMTSARGGRRKKTMIKSIQLLQKESEYREKYLDRESDFVEVLELLVHTYKILEKLDAGGRTLGMIFTDANMRRKKEAVRNWVINLDIWGTSLTSGVQGYDIFMRRTATMTKVDELVKTMQVMLAIRDQGCKKGPILDSIKVRLTAIMNAFTQIQVYLTKKHKNVAKKGDSSCSGSPRSDRMNTFDDEIVEEDKQSPFEMPSPPSRKSVVIPMEEDDITLSVDQYGIRFKDFTEPDILKTGYLIPIQCGHNKTYSVQEKTVYEIHLTNAGFLRDEPAHKSDDES